jgi:hypothetical protein
MVVASERLWLAPVAATSLANEFFCEGNGGLQIGTGVWGGSRKTSENKFEESTNHNLNNTFARQDQSQLCLLL